MKDEDKIRILGSALIQARGDVRNKVFKNICPTDLIVIRTKYYYDNFMQLLKDKEPKYIAEKEN
ncbi:MAG: hypothetical protein KKH98_05330 [Spirochaetes bacterium]|nr:hypothetical protein [Spirochaetota bacterium]